jgi:hypothetical protein
MVYVEGRPPPLYLGLILGEVINDLRSALDQLAWQLALDYAGAEELAKPGVGNAITFPITSMPFRLVLGLGDHRLSPGGDVTIWWLPGCGSRRSSRSLRREALTRAVS